MAVINMTEGSIVKHLIKYSVPLILGNIFQLTYNVVDSVIAGRFIGRDALAAEGTAAPVINIVILGISGICIGASVLMSEFFGADDRKNLRKELSTVLSFGLIFSLILTGAGVLFSEDILRFMNVPKSLMEIASVYLKIIFLGTPFVYFYNALSSALKSVGDSKTPLMFLAFTSILNAVLDLIFIGWLGYGIRCSALTTVIAEALSAILTIVYIYRKIPLLHIEKDEWKIDRKLLKKTLQYGAVTALQQACQPMGKLLVQGAVNPMGVNVMAAFNAVSRVDDYAFTPEQSISHGITTFVAQNRGAKKEKRIEQGFITGLILEFIYWIIICCIVLIAREYIMKIFVTGEESGSIIRLGAEYLGVMAFFYIFPAFTNGIQGFFRGIGNMKITLVGTFIQTSLRVIFVYILTPKIGIQGIAYACAAGWTAMLMAEIPYYFWFVKRRK